MRMARKAVVFICFPVFYDYAVEIVLSLCALATVGSKQVEQASRADSDGGDVRTKGRWCCTKGFFF